MAPRVMIPATASAWAGSVLPAQRAPNSSGIETGAVTTMTLMTGETTA